MLSEPADRPAFSRRIPSFHDDGNTTAAALDPALEPDQFDLEAFQFLLVQQSLPHFFQIDVPLLKQLNEPLAGIDALEVVVREMAAGFADGTASPLPAIAVTFARDNRWDGFQLI